jgi:hypothetical protein
MKFIYVCLLSLTGDEDRWILIELTGCFEIFDCLLYSPNTDNFFTFFWLFWAAIIAEIYLKIKTK